MHTIYCSNIHKVFTSSRNGWFFFYFPKKPNFMIIMLAQQPVWPLLQYNLECRIVRLVVRGIRCSVFWNVKSQLLCNVLYLTHFLPISGSLFFLKWGTSLDDLVSLLLWALIFQDFGSYRLNKICRSWISTGNNK